MSHRAALIAFFALGTVACGPVTASSHSSPASSATGKYQVILAESFNGKAHLRIREADSGKLVLRLATGTPSPDWSRFYWLSQLQDSSQLNVTDTQTGRVVAQTKMPTGLDFPVLGQGITGGISPNGKWLTLYRQTQQAGTLQSDFSVGPSDLSQPFKNVRLAGDFSFDAISNDGAALYLIQRLDDQGRYQVRLYNLASSALWPGVIVDKREPNEPMYGIRGDSVAAADGRYIFTVYARPDGPFIHALPLGLGFAWCVDLPNDEPGAMESQFHWSLALSHDGSTLYAVNGATGSIAQVSVNDQSSPPNVVRSTRFAVSKPSALGFVTDADAKEAPIGGAALSADGRTLFAISGTGIVAIDTTTLHVKARYLEGHSVASTRLSRDGKWLYAASPEAGKVWQLDAATGQLVHELSGLDNPWALFWVRAEA
jgi:hypothetical protein